MDLLCSDGSIISKAAFRDQRIIIQPGYDDCCAGRSGNRLALKRRPNMLPGVRLFEGGRCADDGGLGAKPADDVEPDG